MYLKFGYSRATQDASIDIRDGKMTRQQAIEIAKKYEGKFPKRHFREFLEFTGMTEEEFWKTAERWRGRDVKKTTDAWRKNEKGEWVINEEVKDEKTETLHRR